MKANTTVTIAIFEIYGIKYDKVFRTRKERVEKRLHDQCDTLVIHYIEELPKESLTTELNGIKIPDTKIIQ